jgi:hypothetical protein
MLFYFFLVFPRIEEEKEEKQEKNKIRSVYPFSFY